MRVHTRVCVCELYMNLSILCVCARACLRAYLRARMVQQHALTCFPRGILPMNLSPLRKVVVLWLAAVQPEDLDTMLAVTIFYHRPDVVACSLLRNVHKAAVETVRHGHHARGALFLGGAALWTTVWR